MRRIATAVLGALAVLAVTAPAAAPDAAPLTATALRIGDHPGFVRVVVDFSGGRVNPGEVVRIIAHFDHAGTYPVHCHILEHEENEMMRPFTVQ